MSSKSTRCGIIIISVIHGAVRVLLNEKRFARVDMMDELNRFNKQVASVRDRYAPDYNEKDIVWSHRKLDDWAKKLEELCIPGELQTVVLVNVALTALDDLLAKVNFKPRAELLESLRPTLSRLHDFVDPGGIRFSAFEKADVVLSGLYNLIGFRP